MEQAKSRRAELDAFDAQAETYGQLARTERSRVLPQIALSGGYQYLENQFLDDETVGMAGIGVQWALFDGGQSRKRAAALDRNRRATEQQRADASSQIELQVRQAYLGIQESRQRVISLRRLRSRRTKTCALPANATRQAWARRLSCCKRRRCGCRRSGTGTTRRWTPGLRSCGSRVRSGRSEATRQRKSPGNAWRAGPSWPVHVERRSSSAGARRHCSDAASPLTPSPRSRSSEDCRPEIRDAPISRA